MKSYMTGRLAAAILAWSLAVPVLFAQSFPTWQANQARPTYAPSYYPLPSYPLPAYPMSAYPMSAYAMPTYATPSHSIPVPQYPYPVYYSPQQMGGLPRPLANSVPLMPAPPVPMLTTSVGQTKLAQANPRALPIPPPAQNTALQPDIVKPPPGTEILPTPRELDPKETPVPGSPYADILEFGPGSMMMRPEDGKPDTAPDCPPVAPRGYLYYARAEYLMWWGQNQSAPVLLTEGVPASPLVGGGEVGLIAQTRHGGRFTLGRWLDNAQDCAVEIVGFFIGGDESVYERNSIGTPALARPFINGVTGQPAQNVVAAPGFEGDVQIGMLSRLWGLEGNGRYEVCRWGWGHFDALAGARFLSFDENLTVLAGTTTGPAAANYTYDAFGSRNRFFGCQAGVECEINYRKWFLDSWAKLAIGDNYELVEIQGNRVLGGRVVPGGLLAQPSNIGLHRRHQFGYVPEVAVNVGYQVQQHMRASVGYNFLLLGNVARPGDQIDTRINTTGAGPAVPAFSFNQGEFWIHGLIAGLEFRF